MMFRQEALLKLLGLIVMMSALLYMAWGWIFFFGGGVWSMHFFSATAVLAFGLTRPLLIHSNLTAVQQRYGEAVGLEMVQPDHGGVDRFWRGVQAHERRGWWFVTGSLFLGLLVYRSRPDTLALAYINAALVWSDGYYFSRDLNEQAIGRALRFCMAVALVAPVVGWALHLERWIWQARWRYRLGLLLRRRAHSPMLGYVRRQGHEVGRNPAPDFLDEMARREEARRSSSWAAFEEDDDHPAGGGGTRRRRQSRGRVDPDDEPPARDPDEIIPPQRRVKDWTP